MGKEIIIATISALIGGFITYLFTLASEKRKEKREDRLEAQKIRRVAFQNRPEMQIVDYKDYISRTGYGIKQKADIDLFVASISNVSIDGEKKNQIVNAHYCSEDFNPDAWCCAIYTLKNAGKTAISTLDIVWNYQKTSCIFPSASANAYAENHLLNYSYCHDKKIREGETITFKICYHKDKVFPGLISAPVSVVMIDDNGRYWTQPLFAPQEKIYDSRTISPKEYYESSKTDLAEECFKKPWLW